MKPIVTTGCVSLMLLSLVVPAANAAMGTDETFRLSVPRFWWDNWAVPLWISMVGDADGDGRADLVAVDPPERSRSQGPRLWASGPRIPSGRPDSVTTS